MVQLDVQRAEAPVESMGRARVLSQGVLQQQATLVAH